MEAVRQRIREVFPAYTVFSDQGNPFRDGGKHPYLPRNIVFENYVQQKREYVEILALFGVFVLITGIITAAVFASMYTGKKKMSVNTYKTELLWSLWFVISGLIHMVIEGSFAVWPKYLENDNGFILADLWKEYSKADSRYATYDPFVLAMETVTAFIDGPLCIITAAAIIRESKYRFPIQLLTSTLQLYGDVLYYYTAILEGTDKYCLPTILHYYIYFIAMNAIWIIIPSLSIWDCVKQIGQRFDTKVKLKATANGHHKKEK